MAHRFDNRSIVRRMHGRPDWCSFSLCKHFRHSRAERITLAILACKESALPEPLSKGMSSFDLSYNAEFVWQQKADIVYCPSPVLDAGVVQDGQLY